MRCEVWSRDGHLGQTRAMAAVALKSCHRWLCQLGWRCHMQGPGLCLDLFGDQRVLLAFGWSLAIWLGHRGPISLFLLHSAGGFLDELFPQAQKFRKPPCLPLPLSSQEGLQVSESLHRDSLYISLYPHAFQFLFQGVLQDWPELLQQGGVSPQSFQHLLLSNL